MWQESLRRTRQSVFGRISALMGTSEIQAETWEELEALLVQADLGIETTERIIQSLKRRAHKLGITRSQDLRDALKDELISILPEGSGLHLNTARLLTVILIVGVNGAGKTTTIAKLAYRFSQEGRNVLIAAADTFRAAAIDQLQEWGTRINVSVIASQPGGDPGAVVFDAIKAARARNHDLLIIDTAGRLHTKFNLMEELKKVARVASKNVHEAPHEVWLVVDGTTGQNALTQAKHFNDAIHVTGVIVTKLDSTSRGGMIFAIGHNLQLPVRFVGTGEGTDDLIPFDRKTFVEELFR